MKQCLSILFLSLFFLSQYGKMLAYMECRITAAIESKTDCDCGNTLQTADTDQNSSQPLHQHHLKNYTEEFFDHEWLVKEELTVRNNLPFTILLQQDQLPGYLQGILQPPRS
jgi:hypothetical protein